MKRLLLIMTGLVCVCLVSQSAFAQCNPRSNMLPFVRIQGDLLCPDGMAPTNVTLLEFYVDDVLCAADNYDWTYPRAGAGTYQLNFWIDNTVDHNLRICVQTQCDEGGNAVTYTGGFSADGTTPAGCDSQLVFGASQAAVLMHIVTPVQLSEFTAVAE